LICVYLPGNVKSDRRRDAQGEGRKKHRRGEKAGMEVMEGASTRVWRRAVSWTFIFVFRRKIRKTKAVVLSDIWKAIFLGIHIQ
jgi:hypothetical protein